MSEKGRAILAVILALPIYIVGMFFSVKLGLFVLHWIEGPRGIFEAFVITNMASLVVFLLAWAVWLLTKEGVDEKDVPKKPYGVDTSMQILIWVAIFISLSIGIIMLSLNIAEPVALLIPALGIHGFCWYSSKFK